MACRRAASVLGPLLVCASTLCLKLRRLSRCLPSLAHSAVSVQVLLASAGAQNPSPLPAFNLAAARNNPLKGWTTAPLWITSTDWVEDSSSPPGTVFYDGHTSASPEHIPHGGHNGPYNGDNLYPGQEQRMTSTLEFFYISLHKLMTGTSTNGVITYNFDGLGTHLEPVLAATRLRNKHAVLRVIVDYPGNPPRPEFAVPEFLHQLTPPLTMTQYVDEGGSDGRAPGSAPDYSDERLIAAMEAFIAEFGRRYNGDTRIGFIQLGMLGFWGEWHTAPHTPDCSPAPSPTCNHAIAIPVATRVRVVKAFYEAFPTTKMCIRYPFDLNRPEIKAQYPAFGDRGLLGKFGFHDDSFARWTLDGTATGRGPSASTRADQNGCKCNGFENGEHGADGEACTVDTATCNCQTFAGCKDPETDWFFWPSMLANQAEESWKTAPMGGEVRPELQGILFKEDYPARTYHVGAHGADSKQDFDESAAVTHATYLLQPIHILPLSVCVSCFLCLCVT